jgi:hypothetical protein
MLRSLIVCLFLITNVYAVQDSCTAKAKECKDPVRNPKYYPETHCTCFTCEQGTRREKILCTNDEKESGRMQARVEASGESLNAERKEEKPTIQESKLEEGKSVSLDGWIKEEDGRAVFINAKDKRSWSISNMDAVKGHEGHHVKIKAKLNEADHSINVEKLSMLRKGKQTGDEEKQEEKK